MLTIQNLKAILPLIKLDEKQIFSDVNKQVLSSEGYDGIITILSNIQSNEYPCVILEEEAQGYFSILPGAIETNTISIWVMDKKGYREDANVIFERMKKVTKQILLLLLQEMQEDRLTGLQLDRMPYNRMIGGNDMYGYELMLTFIDDMEL